ncbi:MAG: ABC transporter ATP-binding protein [Acidibacter sp.]|jgi:iron(III) transport system ATP-binding protein|nr:ABC transporter ATP-binding protein [Acidibacter sp.]
MRLELRDIHFRREATEILRGVDLQLETGDIGVLVGPSGCGKTTTLRCIAGLESITGGEIQLGDRIVSSAGYSLGVEDRRVGYVLQDNALFPHLTVADNIRFGLRKLAAEERETRVADMLSLLGLRGLERRLPQDLSGGQQQRVAIARSLAPQPDLLLMDEPFSNLDARLRTELVGELRGLLKKLGITTLLVTHDQHDAFGLADRLGYMNDGQVEQWDTPYDVYHRPRTRAVAKFIGDGVMLPAIGKDGFWHTELGNIEDPAADGSADLLLRPDDLLHDDDSPTQARIVERVFRGADFLYTVQLPSGLRVLALAPSHHDHHVGETLGFRLANDHLVVFRRD